MHPIDLKLFLLPRKDQSRKSQEDSTIFYNIIFWIYAIFTWGGLLGPPRRVRVNTKAENKIASTNIVAKNAHFVDLINIGVQT